MLAEARKFAEEAMKRAPEDSVKIWARILARQQQYDAVFAKLPTLKPATAMQVAQGRRHRRRDLFDRRQSKIRRRDREAAAANPRWRRARDFSISNSNGASPPRWQDPARPHQTNRSTASSRMQKSRLRFDELGAQLEAYDRASAPAKPVRITKPRKPTIIAPAATPQPSCVS